MISAPAASTRMTAARSWHLLTGLVSLASIVVQLVMIVRGVNVLVDDTGQALVGTPTRLVRFFSYFTVQSNLLVIVAAFILGRSPDRDGPGFRVLRIAGLIGITVTFVVYLVALRPILDLSGMSAVTDFGLHIATPILAIGGWVLFGPRPRFERSTLLRSLAWPALYFVYSLIHGAIGDWYPYPFVDVVKIGYPTAIRNLVIVIVLLLAVGVGFLALDRRLRATGPPRGSTSRPVD